MFHLRCTLYIDFAVKYKCITGKLFTTPLGRSVLQLSSFTSWAPGQPNNGNHQQNCVGMMNGQWDDLFCVTPYKYVCSKNAGQSCI